MRSQQDWRWYRVALVAVDAAGLVAAFSLATGLRDAFDAPTPTLTPSLFAPFVYALVPMVLAVLALRGAYARRHMLGGPEEYERVLSGCTSSMLLLIGISYVTGAAFNFSRSWVVLACLLSILILWTSRFLLRRVAYALRHRGFFTHRILIAGVSDQGLSIAAQLHDPERLGANVVGLLDDFLPVGTHLKDPLNGLSLHEFVVIGHPRAAAILAAELHADLIVAVPAALSSESQELFARLSETGQGPEIRIAPTRWDLSAASVESAPLGFVPLLRLQAARITSLESLICTVVDRTLAMLLLLTLAPALLWAVAAAWLRGVPQILVHRRVVGHRGRVVALPLLNPAVSGHVLLHGLPALVAVLRGELALVGPWPVPVEDRATYQRWAGLLLAVKPGLTGPWRLVPQDASMVERVLADVWWVRNWTIWQHLFVLAKSARLVGRRHPGGSQVTRWLACADETSRTGVTGLNPLRPSVLLPLDMSARTSR
jgi:lipopolysaccharide/colanic/teichoic acid biosynthesis glycosyltransferase